MKLLGQWAAGHLLVRVEEYAFDYLFYPYMLYSGGPALARITGNETGSSGYWLGFGLLVMASALLNVAYLRFYDRLRRDWFAFEHLRGWCSRVREERRWRLLRWPIQTAAFGYLSIWHSPLFAILWCRNAERPFAMTRADWLLFALAILLANVGWTFLVTGAVELSRLL